MTVAALIFCQTGTDFGKNSRFFVELDPGENTWIRGGENTNIRLSTLGNHRVRATIDHYTSDWFHFEVEKNDVLQLRIDPPDRALMRMVGLFFNKNTYVSITLLHRSKV